MVKILNTKTGSHHWKRNNLVKFYYNFTKFLLNETIDSAFSKRLNKTIKYFFIWQFIERSYYNQFYDAIKKRKYERILIDEDENVDEVDIDNDFELLISYTKLEYNKKYKELFDEIFSHIIITSKKSNFDVNMLKIFVEDSIKSVSKHLLLINVISINKEKDCLYYYNMRNIFLSFHKYLCDISDILTSPVNPRGKLIEHLRMTVVYMHKV